MATEYFLRVASFGSSQTTDEFNYMIAEVNSGRETVFIYIAAVWHSRITVDLPRELLRIYHCEPADWAPVIGDFSNTVNAMLS